MPPTDNDGSVRRWTSADGQGVGLFESAWRHRLALVVVTVVAAAGAYCLSLVRPPTYEAEATLVFAESTDPDSGQATLPGTDRDRYFATQADRITSTTVVTAAARILGGRASARELASGLSARPGNGSDTLTVIGTARSAARAAGIANAGATGYLTVLRDEVRAGAKAAALRAQERYDSVRRQLQQAAARQPQPPDVRQPNPLDAVELGVLQEQFRSTSAELARLQSTAQEYQPAVSVGHKATAPVSPTSPMPLRDAGFAALIAFMATTTAVWAFDVRMQRRSDVGRFTTILGVACLGRLPATCTRRAHDPSTGTAALAGQWQQVVSAVDASLRKVDGRRVLVTSPGATGEGSGPAVTLALSAAADGRSVVLVDADPARREVSTAAGIAGAPGVTELVEQSGELPRAEAGPAGAGPGVAVLSPGRAVPNSAALYRNASFRATLASLAQSNDLVLVVGAPVLAGPDATVLADASDAVLLLVPVSTTDAQLRETAERLSWGRGELLGYVLLDRGRRRPPSGWWRRWLAIRKRRANGSGQEAARTSVAALLKPLRVVPLRTGRSRTALSSAAGVVEGNQT